MSDIPLRSARRKRADKRITTAWRLACTLVAAFVVWPAAAAEPASKEGIAFFESKIRPVLAKNCYSCHSGSVQAKGACGSILGPACQIGGQSGPRHRRRATRRNSKILSVLNYEGPEMPPAGQLAQRDARGLQSMDRHRGTRSARRESRSPRRRRSTSRQSARPGRTRHRKQPVPRSREGMGLVCRWISFVHAKQEATGTQPVKDAEPIVWLRRVSFDLVGLPPTAGQVAAIERDSSRKAREQTRRSAARIAAVRRALGPALAGRRPIRREHRQGAELRLPPGLALPRLGHRCLQRRQAIQPLPPGADRRRPAAGRLAPSNATPSVIATGFLALGPKGINERNREVVSAGHRR